MTPEQKIKWAMMVRFNVDLPAPVTAEAVDAAWHFLVERDMHWDMESDYRGGDVETKLTCEWSRHYESKAVGARMPDGSWVGWTYWYGGGKHGEPGSIDWMGCAYEITCHEEQKVVTVQTFAKAVA